LISFVNQFFEDSLISNNVGTNTVFDDLGSEYYSVYAVIQIANITGSGYPKISFLETKKKIETENEIVENQELPQIEIFSFGILVILPTKKVIKMTI